MKKSAVFLGAIVVVAGAYTGLSWWVGSESEKVIRASIEQANQRLNTVVAPNLGIMTASLAIQDYQRGVFSSQARYILVVNDGQERRELVLEDHLQHGPFPLAQLQQGIFRPLLAYSSARLVETPAVKTWFEAARGTVPMTIETRIETGGEGTSTWAFAPLEWNKGDGQLSFSGGDVVVRFTEDARQGSAEGRFGSLKVVDGEDGSLAVNDIRLTSETTTQANDRVQVKGRLAAANVVAEGVLDIPVKLEDVSTELNSTQVGDVVDVSVLYDFRRILVGDMNVGSVSVGGEATRLDYRAMARLLAEYDAIEAAHGDDEDFELTDAEVERLIAAARPALATRPEIALKPVTWRNDKGESTFTFAVAFEALPADLNLKAADDPSTDFLREVKLELSLSKAMLMQAFAQMAGDGADEQEMALLAGIMFDSYVADLESQGLVKREGDNTRVTVIYREGEVDVNGQIMTVYEFIDLFGDFI